MAVVIIATTLVNRWGAGTDPAASGTALTRVDAVMPVPDDPDLTAPGDYWMFSDDHYIRARISASNQPAGQSLRPSAPLRTWTGTFQKLSGFQSRIDATLRVPGSRNEYWVFSGTQYLKIRLADESYDDAVIEGPGTLH